MTAYLGQIFGDYRLRQWLGLGRFAQVYLGEHHRRKHPVVMKVFRTHLSLADQVYFWAEARTLSYIAHSHLIRLSDFDIVADSPMLVMEFAPQGTLRQRHARPSPLDPARVSAYVQQLAGALAAAHAAQVIHGQLSPQQVLLGPQGELLLSDFSFPSLKRQWQAYGVPPSCEDVAYLAPEQFQGGASPASDQYALGIMAYEWLTGQRPFQGSPQAMYYQHIFTAPLALRVYNPGLSPALEAVVQRALAKDPGNRFPTIQCFAEALAQAIPDPLPKGELMERNATQEVRGTPC